MDVMSEQPKEEEVMKPSADPRFAGETPEERRTRNKRAYEKWMALKGKLHLDIDIDELRGRKRS